VLRLLRWLLASLQLRLTFEQESGLVLGNLLA